jgi:hypothetical protein
MAGMTAMEFKHGMLLQNDHEPVRYLGFDVIETRSLITEDEKKKIVDFLTQ